MEYKVNLDVFVGWFIVANLMMGVIFCLSIPLFVAIMDKGVDWRSILFAVVVAVGIYGAPTFYLLKAAKSNDPGRVLWICIATLGLNIIGIMIELIYFVIMVMRVLRDANLLGKFI